MKPVLHRPMARRCTTSTGIWTGPLNTLRPRQDGRHFPYDIFKCIFVNENVWILIKISLKFVPKGPIISIPSLVQIMVWRRPGAKPLPEPMMVSLRTHICVTRPQWVNINALVSGRYGSNFAFVYFKFVLQIDIWSISSETASGEYHKTSLTISQHRKQTITWIDADPDLCHHMISLG